MQILKSHKLEEDIIVEWKFDDREEVYFETQDALIALLYHEVVFLNSFWFKKDWPEDAKKQTSLSVNANDAFAWACSDAEGMDYSEIQEVYEHWEKDPIWGSAVWCCKKRNEMPQKPVADDIRKAGIWDLDSMGLQENSYDKACREKF